MERLRRLLKRSWAEKGLLFQVALMLGGIRIGLSLLPFKTVRRFLAWSSKKPVGSPVDKATYYKRVIWAVNAVGRRMLGDKRCLPQALVAQWLLRRRGYAAALHIGVIGSLIHRATNRFHGRPGQESPYRFKWK